MCAESRCPSRTAQRGLTFIELLFFIVIVSAGLAGILTVLNVTTSRSADPMVRKQMLAVAEHIEGQLTAAVHATADDRETAARLLPVLERKVGRILFNGFGTGVEVSHAMVHGGPFPSTSDSRSTSVGAGAIDRFVRPVCYQDVPSYLLPESLTDENPQNIPRVVNGDLAWKA